MFVRFFSYIFLLICETSDRRDGKKMKKIVNEVFSNKWYKTDEAWSFPLSKEFIFFIFHFFLTLSLLLSLSLSSVFSLIFLCFAICSSFLCSMFINEANRRMNKVNWIHAKKETVESAFYYRTVHTQYTVRCTIHHSICTIHNNILKPRLSTKTQFEFCLRIAWLSV